MLPCFRRSHGNERYIAPFLDAEGSPCVAAHRDLNSRRAFDFMIFLWVGTRSTRTKQGAAAAAGVGNDSVCIRLIVVEQRSTVERSRKE